MSTRTPTKQKSASKKTPVKSTSKKQQVNSANKSLVKNSQSQSAKKNVNLINEIKDKFLSSNTQSLTSNDLCDELKQVLSQEGIEIAIVEFTNLIRKSNIKAEIIAKALTKLDSENVSALVYLIEQTLNQQGNNKTSLDLSFWIAAIFQVHHDLVLYNDKIKTFVNTFSSKSVKEYEHLPIIRGKIALLAGF